MELQELTIVPREESLQQTKAKIKSFVKVLLDRKDLVTVFSSEQLDDTLEDAVYNSFLNALKKSIETSMKTYDLFHQSLAQQLLWTIVS